MKTTTFNPTSNIDYFAKPTFGDCRFFCDGDNPPTPAPAPTPISPPEKPKKITAEQYAAQYDSNPITLARKAMEAEKDSFTDRRKVRELQDEVDSYASGTFTDGRRLITKEEAAILDGYKKIGTVTEIQTLQTEQNNLKQENAQTKREAGLREVADNVGPGEKFNFKIFKDLDAKIPGIEYDLREVSGEGDEKVKKYFAKYEKTENGKKLTVDLPLSELAAKEWSDYLPALRAGQQEPEMFGTAYPEQIPSGGDAPLANGSLSASYNASRYGHNAGVDK